MRVIGIITEYISNKGGYGKIICEEQLEVRFERFECNYDTVRVNDKVRFDLVKSFDGIYDALDVEFISNSELKELDSSYQKQSPVLCHVLYSTPKGFVIAYKNITLFLPAKFCFDEEIQIGKTREFYVHTFSYDSILIATTKKVRPEGLIETFAPHINSKQSFLFQIIEIGEYGILMSKDAYIGFVPNNHIVPYEKEKLQVGEECFAKVIGCSMSTGLVLSIRNHYSSDSLIRLKAAFEGEEILTGSVIGISNKVYLIKCLDLRVKMNIQHLAYDAVQIGEEVHFKIIDFSMSKDISVSNIEVTQFGILNQLRSTNVFTVTVASVRENGLFVAVNELYKTAFLPLEELTEIFDKKDVLSKIKIGSFLHCSIYSFNCFGLYVSRLKYKRKKRQGKATFFYNVNDRVRLKIKDKMAMFGFLVESESVKGLISIENILPEAIRANINLMPFVKHTKNIFKRRSYISCFITKVDKENNQVFFDFDLADIEVEQKVEEMISFFSSDIIMYHKMKSYYYEKKQQQLKTLTGL